MKVNRLLSAIMNESWAILPSYAEAQLPFIRSIMKGNFDAAISRSGAGEYEQPTRSGSTAIIPIVGPIIKYDGFCGEVGSQTRMRWLNNAANDESVNSIVLILDTPGGQVAGTEEFGRLVKSISNMGKPVVAFIDDLCASAGMWIAAPCDAIFAQQKTATVGSIGVYTTLVDAKGAFEKEGYKIKEIYAPESTEKNKGWRDALEHNDDRLIKDDLSLTAQTFRSWVSDNRPALTNDSWNKGRTMPASEAVSIGLIDDIKSLEETITYAQQLAQNSGQGSAKTDMKFTKLKDEAKAGKVSDTAIEEANTELTEAGITSVSLVQDSFVTEAAGVTEQLTSVKADLATEKAAKEKAEQDLATAQATLKAETEAKQKMQTELDEANAKLSGKPGATHKANAGTDTPADETGEQSWEEVLAALPHNQNADRILGLK